MEIDRLFYQLLQVAIGTRNTLDMQPTSREWALLFELSKKQSLVAVAFWGVYKLNSGSDFGSSLGFDEVTYLKWLGLIAKVAQRNKEVTEACREVTELLEKDGFHSCVLKGQSNLVNYPEELRSCRTAGDIDIWLMPHENGLGGVMEPLSVRRKRIVAYVNQKVGKQHVLYHHVDLPIVLTGAVDVEAHFTPSWMKSPIANKRVQRFFEEEWMNIEKVTDGYCVPSAKMNVVYQLMHVYRHLFNEGIGLRQVLDYYFVLKHFHEMQGEFADRSESFGEPCRTTMGMWAESLGRSVPSNEEMMHLLGRLGLLRFAKAVNWVLQDVFGMPSVYMICEPDAASGRFLLEEIMAAGNFGKFDSRSDGAYAQNTWSHNVYKAKRNMRLLKFFPSEVLWAPYFYWLQNYGCWRREL